MTTLILAQKLGTLKLDKTEYEKIECQRMRNMQKKRKTVNTLKEVLDRQNLYKTCRLCMRIGAKKVIDNEDFSLANNIKNLFGIVICPNDGKPQHICVSCDIIVSNAIELKKTAEITQWRLEQERELLSESWEEPLVEDNEDNGKFVILKDGSAVRQWTCRKCNETFQNKEDYHDHEKQLSCKPRMRCYVCECCGKELKSLSRLKRHKLIHNSDLQYACIHCPYRARTKYALVVHERCHSGQRPLSCASCSATFTNSSSLASHRRRHLPPRYHCDDCQKGFKFKEALQNHIATQHSSVKLHTCSYCGKSFSTRKMICRHERRVHNRPRLRSGIIPTYIRQQEESEQTQS